MRLGTCLVQQQCVFCAVASAACVTADKCCVLFLIALHLLCTVMDEARALVRALCNCSVSAVPWPLLHAWLLINDLFLISLHLLCTGMDEACALVRALCNSSVSSVPWPLLHAWLQINDLFLIALHLLCTGMDEARALVRA